MTDQLLLDVLLGLIIALFLPIGFWHGVRKEVCLSAGILLGATLANSWARPWGGDLAGYVDLAEPTARFSVAIVALLATTILVGFLGGSVLDQNTPGVGARLCGALLAGINGALLVGYVLTFIDRFLDDESAVRTIDDGLLSRILLREFGWVLIGVAGAAALMILLAAFVQARRANERTDLSHESASEEVWSARSAGRTRPLRPPSAADSGKFEPAARSYDMASGRFGADAPRVAESIALPRVEPSQWSVDRAAPDDRGASRFGRRRKPTDGQTASGDWLSRTAQPESISRAPNSAETKVVRVGSDNRDGDGRTPPPPEAAVEPRHGKNDTIQTHSQQAPGARVPANAKQRQCPACGSRITESDVFCPDCGAVTR